MFGVSDQPPQGTPVRIAGETATPVSPEDTERTVNLKGVSGQVATVNPHYPSRHHREQCTVMELDQEHGGGTVAIPTRQLEHRPREFFFDLSPKQRARLQRILSND